MGFYDVLGVVLLVIAYCCWIISTEDLEWSSFTLERVGGSHYAIISPVILGTLRSLCAIIIDVTINIMYSDTKGIELSVLMRDGSHRKLKLLHGERFTAFTVWSWILQGFYFVFSAACSFALAFNLTHPILTDYIVPLAGIFFEISLPIAFLVSLVVTYVLIPSGKRAGLPVTIFFQTVPLLMHNANVIFMMIEFFINDIPFNFWHFTFMLFYAIAYVLFSWVWFWYKGIFYYFFLDYGRPWAVLSYSAVLVFVLLLFFGGYACYELKLAYNGVPARLAVLVLTLLSLKLRDTDDKISTKKE